MGTSVKNKPQKVDRSVCRLRKDMGLACHNCYYYDFCPEIVAKRKEAEKSKPKKKPNPNPTKSRSRWTPEDDEIIKNRAITTEDAASLLGRTQAAVKSRRKRLGISTRR